jgi:serine/threonine-protein kinase
MGKVYEAENIHLKRLVAVKVVAGDARSEALQRLEREARIVASIQHPNVCDVHDVGRVPGGSPYVVFERLFGQTLAARAAGGQLPIREVIGIFAQLLSGLHAAHSMNIVHRDLKPENIFLVERAGCDPLVKVMDFGFARDLTITDEVPLTRPGKMCGTMQYMAPEQLRAERADHRSDLFAVGIMLYEALAGRHPFEAASAVELQINILRATPRPLRVRRPMASKELEDLVAWTLSRAPSERPSSALELQRALLSAGRQHSKLSFDDDAPVSVTEPLWAPIRSTPSSA